MLYQLSYAHEGRAVAVRVFFKELRGGLADPPQNMGCINGGVKCFLHQAGLFASLFRVHLPPSPLDGVLRNLHVRCRFIYMARRVVSKTVQDAIRKARGAELRSVDDDLTTTPTRRRKREPPPPPSIVSTFEEMRVLRPVLESEAPPDPAVQQEVPVEVLTFPPKHNVSLLDKDDERIERFFRGLKLSASTQVGAAYAGISHSTVVRWIEIGRAEESGKYHDFVGALDLAIAEFEHEHLTNLTEAAKTDPKWSAWLLERVIPQRYGKQDNVRVTGDEDKPIVFKVRWPDIPKGPSLAAPAAS